MKNIDKIVDKLLAEGDKLTPARIEAFAKVIHSLKGANIEPKPNNFPSEPNAPELTEDFPMNLSDIEKVEFAGIPNSERKIAIQKQQKV